MFWKAACFSSGLQGAQARHSGARERSPAPVLPEVLLQLRDGRQQLLALVAAKRQLQELRSPILNSHSANFLNHLDHSYKQKIRFRCQLLWTASKMSRKKAKNISINRSAILKLTRFKSDFTLGKCTWPDSRSEQPTFEMTRSLRTQSTHHPLPPWLSPGGSLLNGSHPINNAAVLVTQKIF